MIEYLKFRIALSGFFRQKAKIRSGYLKEIAAAHAGKKQSDDIRCIEHYAWFEEGSIDEEISILVTSYLTSKAMKRFIAIPSHEADGMWEQCNKISERWVLTNAGISSLRSSLRAEAKERRDLIVPIIAALTGIIGSATGLIAILTR